MNRSAMNNFTAGEFTPQLGGRFDLSKFKNSYELGENFVPRPFGGMFKRTGFEMIAPLKYDSKVPRIIEFEFSTEMSYIIVLENLVMRFFTNTGGVVSNTDGSVYELTTPYLEASLEGIRTLQSEDIMYILHPDYPVKKLIRYSTNSWALVDVDFIDGPFADVNTDDGHNITFSARNGMITLTSNKDIFTAEMVDGIFKCGIGCMRIISVANARSATAFVTASIDATYITRTLGAELCPVFTASGCTATASSITGMSNGSSASCNITTVANKEYLLAFTILSGVDCSTTKRIKVKVTNGANILFEADYCFGNESTWFYFNSSSYTSANIAFTYYGESGSTCGIDYITCRQDEPDAGMSTTQWAEGAFSEKNGYPVTGTFHEERLVLAGTAANPTTIWISTSGKYENFNMVDQEKATSAMQLKLAARKFDFINWIMSKKDLWVGTRAGIWRITPASSSSAISPTNVKASYENQYGSADMDCTVVDNVIIYPQRSGSKIRNIEYELATDSYKGDEISIFGEHILRDSPLRQWAWQQEPYGILWMVRDDGLLVGMTYMKTQDVLAWHRHPLRGTDTVESIGTIPSYKNTDQVWVCTKRTINGQTRRFVERLSYETSDQSRKLHLDCSLTRDDTTETTTVSGLTHLIGESVSVVVDGARHNDVVVDGTGHIALEYPGNVIHVGLPYAATIKTHILEKPINNDVSQGVDSRIVAIVARVLDTGASVSVGPLENLSEIYMRGTDPMDVAVPLFTGDVRLPFSGGWGDETTSFYLIHDAPFPCNVLCLIVEWETGDIS